MITFASGGLTDCQLQTLDAVRQRYVKRLVQDYERNGLQLPQDKQQQVQEWKQKLSKLAIQYHQNLTEETTELRFSPGELAGLSEDFISRLEKDEEGKFKVRFNGDGIHPCLEPSGSCNRCIPQVVLSYPTVFPILNTCTVERTRKAVELAFNRRCIDSNVEILEEMLELRHQVATTMGYENHAAYVLEQRYPLLLMTGCG